MVLTGNRFPLCANGLMTGVPVCGSGNWLSQKLRELEPVRAPKRELSNGVPREKSTKSNSMLIFEEGQFKV